MDRNRYKPRIADKRLDFYLSTFGAVCVEGPKWCGKTWTCTMHSTPKANFLLGCLGEILRIANWPCLMSSAPWREPLRILLMNGRMSPRFGMPYATRWMNRRNADATSSQVRRRRKRRGCFIPELGGSHGWPCIPCPCRKVDILRASFLSRMSARVGKSAYSRFQNRPWMNSSNS